MEIIESSPALAVFPLPGSASCCWTGVSINHLGQHALQTTSQTCLAAVYPAIYRFTREQPRQLVVARGILDAYRRDKGLAVPTEQQQQGSTGLLERASKGLGGVRLLLATAPGLHYASRRHAAAGTLVGIVFPPERMPTQSLN